VQALSLHPRVEANMSNHKLIRRNLRNPTVALALLICILVPNGRGARAQTVVTPSGSSATTVAAAIASEIRFTVIDDALECGTIGTGATSCGFGQGSASIEVTANDNWALTVSDSYGEDPLLTSQVTMYNLNFNMTGDGTFTLGVNTTPSNGSPGANIPVTFTTGTIPSSGAGALSMDDGSGSFEGTFAVVISQD